MKNPMNKRYFRELRSDLGKYLVIFLFIVMVVSVVSGFLSANAGVAESYKNNLEKNRVENGHLSFNIRPDDELLDAVAAAADMDFYPADYFEETNDGKTLRVYTVSDKVNIPEVVEGRLPERNDEIALDNLNSLARGLKIGDRIPVDGHELTITGFVALPNYSAMFKDNADLMFDKDNFGIGVMTEEGFEAFSSEHMTVGYAWRYHNEAADDKAKRDASEKVLSALRDELTKENTEIYMRAMAGEQGLTMLEVKDFIPGYENKSINFAGEDMNGDSAAMTMFLYIVVAVLAFIVAVTTINTLTREASVIGTLRASGYTRGEMVRHYAVLPILSFILGMIVGNVLGYTGLHDFMMNIYRSMYSLGAVKTSWNSEAFLKTTLVPTLIMIAINLAILTWKLRIRPLAFLRREISGSKKKRAARLSTKIPFTWRFRIRIILQNMSNYVTMAVGVVLAGAIIIFGLMFQPLLEEVSKRIADTTISRYQYILKTPEEASEAGAEKFAAETLETAHEDYKTDEVTVYGIVEGSRYIKKPIPAGQVLLSNGFMDKYGVHEGDTVSLYDKYSDRFYDFKVAGEYPYEASLAVFARIDDFNETFDKTPDYYSGYFSDEKLGSLTTSNVYMVADSEAIGGFADQLWKSFADFMGPVRWFGVIMFVLMVYLLAKQVIERNAVSISMTKILGFTPGEIGGLYIVSTSIMVIGSLFLAIPLVDRLLKLIFKTYLYKRLSGYLPYCVSSDCYINMVLLGVGSYIAVAALQLLKIRRIKKSEALKTIE
jgi:putative ABC transport system permease protein